MLVRSTVTRSIRLPARNCAVARFYSDGASDGPIGTGGSDNGFLKREKAKEDYFVRQHEKEQLQHLREQLKEQQKKIDHLTNQIKSLSK
ncbi:hypothetical protein HG535_0G01550 [Zygotorulaspora mrakii]|uniref:ATPase inhibitor, mitochondrial n=1 Tax=Zygotorulaspora mrakii TaxID=42260 RepID=A0A7H9B6G7_ZYGMR|nr:uncharacterized protein HG535_0G01550 [Zygotorulaspora mrakii]QLG74271.1 hypothetical protein HG535_0G01550 [Zygotorulaspora mrakii]